MRILHVVTLMSPDGAYGGPVRVAVNQAVALRERGHDVVITAAASGYDRTPADCEQVPLRLFPAGTAIPRVGFAGMRAKGMLGWLSRHAAEFDVVHVHVARDLVTLPAAVTVRRAGVPTVVQPHGMIDATAKRLARPLDRFLTVPVLRAASTVFHLTDQEAADLTAVAGAGLALAELPNGVPVAAMAAAPSAEDPEVLFLARLHARKRPDLFVRMACRLVAEGVTARFALVGPDEGMADTVRGLLTRAPAAARIQYEGPLSPQAVLTRMARASVYVLPAVDEPYGMSVVEAMSLGLPVVVTDSCGLAGLIRETGSGLVVGPDENSLTEAVRTLLAHPEDAARMGAAGRATVLDRLAMTAVADRLETAYAKASST